MLGMATAAIWPSIFQENQTRSPLTRDSTHPPGHHPQGEHAAHPLAQKGRPGHTGNPHIKGSHKQHVHRDVCRGGNRQKQERGAAVAQRRKNARCHIVKEQEGQPQGVDVQILCRVGHQLRRGADEHQQAPAAQQAHRHQGTAEHHRADKRRGDGGFHGVVVFCAEVPGNDDRAADVAAE